jgi:hypothetical protein
MNGAAAVGASLLYARQDHVHPTDTTRVPEAPNDGQQYARQSLGWSVVSGGGSPSNANPVMDGVAAPGVSALYARGDHVHPTDTSRAPLASPAFSGTPTAPTPTTADNTTKLATTAFVTTAVAAVSGSGTPSNTNPIMNGVAAPGVATAYSRGDHVHPTDTSRAKSGANSDITSLSGLTTPLSVGQGGTGNTGGAWSTFAAIVTPASGAFGSASITMRYQAIGKTVSFQADITISSNGTGAGSVNFTLPVTALSTAVFMCREDALSGTICQAKCNGSSAALVNGSNSYPASNGSVFRITGVYESV